MQENSCSLLTVTSKGKFHSQMTGAESDEAGDRENNDDLGLEVALLTSRRLTKTMPCLIVNNLHIVGNFP